MPLGGGRGPGSRSRGDGIEAVDVEAVRLIGAVAGEEAWRRWRQRTRGQGSRVWGMVVRKMALGHCSCDFGDWFTT